MDEINRNPDLLPNMSLIIRYTLGHCDRKTGIPTPYLFHKKKQSPIHDYFCNEETMCSFLLSESNWEVSLSSWNYLNSFLSPRVSYHWPGILNIMFLWGILIAIKKVNGCVWTYAYVNLSNPRILTIQKHVRPFAKGYHQK
jgi:vomeronasal 2 receptor